MDRFSLEDQISEVMSTTLYKSGESFSVSEMLRCISTTKHSSRLQEILREMHHRGCVKGSGTKRNEAYQKSGSTWLRKRWISEKAENLCSRDT